MNPEDFPESIEITISDECDCLLCAMEIESEFFEGVWFATSPYAPGLLGSEFSEEEAVWELVEYPECDTAQLNMNNRRSFLKGLLATAALVATAKVVAASEMLGTTEKVEPPKPPARIKYDPVNYIGEWRWRNLEGQPLGENGFYSARF